MRLTVDRMSGFLSNYSSVIQCFYTRTCYISSLSLPSLSAVLFIFFCPFLFDTRPLLSAAASPGLWLSAGAAALLLSHNAAECLLKDGESLTLGALLLGINQAWATFIYIYISAYICAFCTYGAEQRCSFTLKNENMLERGSLSKKERREVVLFL